MTESGQFDRRSAERISHAVRWVEKQPQAYPLSISKSARRAEIITGGAGSVTRLRYQSGAADYYVCRSWDSVIEGTDNIYVAKSWLLQRGWIQWKYYNSLIYEFTADNTRNVYAGISGTLTTRTSDYTGKITKTSHGLVNGDTVDIRWLPFWQYGTSIAAVLTTRSSANSGLLTSASHGIMTGDLMNIGTVSGTSVLYVTTNTILFSGGTGELPDQGDAITIGDVYRTQCGIDAATVTKDDNNIFTFTGGTTSELLPPVGSTVYYCKRGTSYEAQTVFPVWIVDDELWAISGASGVYDPDGIEIVLNVLDDRDWGAA